MKRFKKPKPVKVTMSVEELHEKLETVCASAVEDTSLLYMVACKDEFGFGYEDIERLFKRANRYAGYLDDHAVEMKDLAKDLEKNTGIKVKWK